MQELKKEISWLKTMDICYRNRNFIHQLRTQELKKEHKYTTIDTANLTTRTEKVKMWRFYWNENTSMELGFLNHFRVKKHRSRLIKTYLIQNPDNLMLCYRGSYWIWSLISDNIGIWLSNQTDHVPNKPQLSTF